MDDALCYQFFQKPYDPLQRRYEALRAVFVEGLSQKQAANKYGLPHGTLRNVIHDFRQACHDGSPPPFFFLPDGDDLPQSTIRVATR
jgi:hypothetical protein